MAFVLIGFMGAGKSSAARELARSLDVEVLDSDALLAQRLGHSIAHEFELHGEQAFRAVEEQLVCELLEDRARPADAVIALGGGSVLSARVRAALAGHVTVLLDVEPDAAWERVRAAPNDSERPLARDRDAFVALHAQRRAIYEDLADAILPQLRRGGIARTAGALRALAAAPAGTRMLWASAASGEYPVLVGRGLLGIADAVELGRIWPVDRSRSRVFCVTDETVSRLYGDRLGGVAGTFAIPAGEGPQDTRKRRASVAVPGRRGHDAG